MYLLPWRQEATKTIMDHLDENIHCDIYKTPSIDEQLHFTNKFVKFIETWVNRIKRSTLSLRVSYKNKILLLRSSFIF